MLKKYILLHIAIIFVILNFHIFHAEASSEKISAKEMNFILNKKYNDIQMSKKMLSTIIIIATKNVYQRYHVYIDPLLILAMIQQESSFKVNSISHKGAYGLMQITWSVWNANANPHKLDIFTRYSIKTREDLFDPVKNILAGTEILGYYLQKTKNIKKALGKYHGSGIKGQYWKSVLLLYGELKFASFENATF